ncbi:5450_t:CDS:2, partial [Scutellospora calospora]
KARSLANKQEYHTLYPDIHKCQFSHKWVDIAQRLPEEYIEEQQSFLSFILYRRSEHNYPLNLIGNMDETPIAFNMPNQTTVEESGKKTISILTTDHERTCFTVTLACLADSTKLPPFIIFKLVNVPRERFPDGVYVHANSSGWMNETEMIWWVENIWRRRANLGSNPRLLLVLDAFAGHKTDLIKRRIHVSLNKPFKAK